jgi:hypothetical protein
MRYFRSIRGSKAILPREKRESNIDAWEEKIVETDDPRWIESERAIMLSFDAETDAACVLVSICPTTMAGIIALLRYANRPIRTGKCGRPNSLPMTGPKPVHGITSLLRSLQKPCPAWRQHDRPRSDLRKDRHTQEINGRLATPP